MRGRVSRAMRAKAAPFGVRDGNRTPVISSSMCSGCSKATVADIESRNAITSYPAARSLARAGPTNAGSSWTRTIRAGISSRPTVRATLTRNTVGLATQSYNPPASITKARTTGKRPWIPSLRRPTFRSVIRCNASHIPLRLSASRQARAERLQSWRLRGRHGWRYRRVLSG